MILLPIRPKGIETQLFIVIGPNSSRSQSDRKELKPNFYILSRQQHKAPNQTERN